jgi:ankyrin repeat protein
MTNKLLVLIGGKLNALSPTDSATILGDGTKPITLEEIKTLAATPHNAVLINAHGDVIDRGKSGEHAILSDVIGEGYIKIIDCIRQIQEHTGIKVFFISGCYVGAAIPGLETLLPGTTVYLGASSKHVTTTREAEAFAKRVIDTYDKHPDIEEMQKQFFANQILESSQTVFRREVVGSSSGDGVGNNETVKIKAISPKYPQLLATQESLVNYLKGEDLNKNAQLFQTDNEELAQSFIEDVRNIISVRIENLNQQELKDLLDNYINEAAFEAIVRGNTSRFKEWFKKGAKENVNHTDNEGNTFMYSATYKGNLEIVKLLIKHGAEDSINQANNKSDTPILIATEKNNLEMVKLLIKHGANINQADDDGYTPILIATDNNNLEMLKLLLEHGANGVNQANNDGDTPILIATDKNNPEIVKLLIEHGANSVNQASDEGDHIMQLEEGPLLENKLKDEVPTNEFDELESQPVEHDNSSANKGFFASISDLWHNLMNILEILKLVIKGTTAIINQANDKGVTPILWATCKDDLEMVKTLIEHGADIHKADNEGVTPILCAAYNNNLEMVKTLIEHRADIHKADDEGVTPILCAAYKGNLEIVQLLIEHGADINQADDEGITPILCAAYNNNIKMVQLLIEHGADINQADDEGDTPILIATDKNNPEIVKLLLEHGADINQADDEDWTPILIATDNNNLEMVKLLLGHGADIHKSDDEGDTPILIATDKNNPEMVQLLIEHGANSVNQASDEDDHHIIQLEEGPLLENNLKDEVPTNEFDELESQPVEHDNSSADKDFFSSISD